MLGTVVLLLVVSCPMFYRTKEVGSSKNDKNVILESFS